MKKKVYEKPMLISEAFIPNEYVAACAENPGYTKYSFTCNAGEGVTHYIPFPFEAPTKYVWDVYVDGKKITRRGYYGPCGSTHTVTVPAGTPVEQVFLKGYMDDAYTDVNENIQVYVWRGENNNNVHCMLNPGTEHIAVPKQMS